jgi:hypothetical protein
MARGRRPRLTSLGADDEAAAGRAAGNVARVTELRAPFGGGAAGTEGDERTVVFGRELSLAAGVVVSS